MQKFKSFLITTLCLSPSLNPLLAQDFFQEVREYTDPLSKAWDRERAVEMILAYVQRNDASLYNRIKAMRLAADLHRTQCKAEDRDPAKERLFLTRACALAGDKITLYVPSNRARLHMYSEPGDTPLDSIRRKMEFVNWCQDRLLDPQETIRDMVFSSDDMDVGSRRKAQVAIGASILFCLTGARKSLKQDMEKLYGDDLSQKEKMAIEVLNDDIAGVGVDVRTPFGTAACRKVIEVLWEDALAEKTDGVKTAPEEDPEPSEPAGGGEAIEEKQRRLEERMHVNKQTLRTWSNDELQGELTWFKEHREDLATLIEPEMLDDHQRFLEGILAVRRRVDAWNRRHPDVGRRVEQMITKYRNEDEWSEREIAEDVEWLRAKRKIWATHPMKKDIEEMMTAIIPDDNGSAKGEAGD